MIEAHALARLLRLASPALPVGAFGGLAVSLDVPSGKVRPGGSAELSARIVMGTAKRSVSGAQFVITGPGLAADGLNIPASGAGPFRTTFSPPREGVYEVEFEANVEGATVRANRTMTVKR